MTDPMGSGESAVAATPTTYVFAPPEMFAGDPMDTAHLHDSFAIHVDWRGGGTWAVTRGIGWSSQQVWNGTEWEYEPRPSSRDDDFIARCRFTLDEALAIGARLSGRPAPSGEG